MLRRSLVIVDHGSRIPEANAVVAAIAAAIRARGEYDEVVAAHLEAPEPTLSGVVRRCVDGGTTHLFVVPYFLASGRHVARDIPAKVSEAVGDAEVEVRIGAPLGFDGALVDLVIRRAREAPLR